MWPWSRRHASGDGPAVVPEAITSDTPGLSRGSAPRDEWRALAPMPTVVQRSAGVIAPLAPSLTSWRSPATLRPLSHLVTGSAPSGVVQGATAGLPSPAATAAAPDEVSVQRAVPSPASGVSIPGSPVPVGLPTASPAVGPHRSRR
jgi:hypothetical protein